MKRKYIADLAAGEIEEALVVRARKFNAECIRLGISRVHLLVEPRDRSQRRGSERHRLPG